VNEFTGPRFASEPDGEQVFGCYADLSWRITPRVELAPGVRLDGYRSAGGLTGSVEPRLAGRIEIARDIVWVSTLGVARQEPAYVVPVPGLRIDPTGGLQAAYQLGEGAEVRLPWNLHAKATAFYHADRNMSDYVSDCGSLATVCNTVSRVNGRTYGLELLVQRPFGERLSGWLAYTASRAERRIGDATYLSPFDRTHVFSGVLSYDFGADVRAGVRATMYSGRPEFPTFYFGSQTPAFAFGPGQLAQHRLPGFYRIDLKAEKRWRLRAGRWIAVVFDFFDATLATEPVDYRCDVASGLCKARDVGPITLPSIGVEAGF
jgi:outer membrane receptor protein involved in Fe transport